MNKRTIIKTSFFVVSILAAIPLLIFFANFACFAFFGSGFLIEANTDELRAARFFVALVSFVASSFAYLRGVYE